MHHLLQTSENVTLWCRGEDPSREVAVQSPQRVSMSNLQTACLLDGEAPVEDACQLVQETSYHGHLISNQIFHVGQ